jgi:predicted RNA-binding Zn-ribbon protein involved in translation (DUF1610 family)
MLVPCARMIPTDSISGEHMLKPLTSTRVRLTCSACGGDINCRTSLPRPSLVECACPHCGMVDVYPESRLRDVIGGR